MALLLMRHGPTALNGEHKVRGLLNVGLSHDGERVARELASKAKHHPIVDLKSSDMKRATQTAHVVGKAAGVHVTAHPELRPWDLGTLAGQDVEKAMPVIQRLVAHPDVKAPGGESFGEFSKRLIDFLRDDIRDDQLHGVMAHGSGATTIEAAIEHGLADVPAVKRHEASIKPGGMAKVTAEKFQPLFREASGDHGIAS